MANAVQGLPEFDRTMAKLSDAVKGDALMEATKAGTEIVHRDAVRRAPRRIAGGLKRVSKGSSETRAPGNLKAHIGMTAVQVSPSRVSSSVGFEKYAWYGRLVELGHFVHAKGSRGKLGRLLGHAAAKPFLRPALEANQKQILTRVRWVFLRNIEKAIRGNR